MEGVLRRRPTDSLLIQPVLSFISKWRKDIPLELRKDYRGGEVMFVDYAGEGIPYIEITTGEERRAEIFVGTLGASNLIYCEAQESQKQKDWIEGHINAFQHIGGVPEKVVPDNLSIKDAKHPDNRETEGTETLWNA